MTGPFSEAERTAIGARLDEVLGDAVALGALEYVERLLTALDHDPPHIWAAPGSWAGDGPGWLELGPWERQAWAERIEAWRAAYARIADGTADDHDRRVLFEHACEAVYGDPAYGGNRDGAGWQRIHFPEPLFPPRREPA